MSPTGSSFKFVKSDTITTTSSAITMPTSGSRIHAITVRAPSTNTDLIYVSLTDPATAADVPFVPGTGETLACAAQTIYALAASGTQSVHVISHHR